MAALANRCVHLHPLLLLLWFKRQIQSDNTPLSKKSGQRAGIDASPAGEVQQPLCTLEFGRTGDQAVFFLKGEPHQGSKKGTAPQESALIDCNNRL